MIEWNENPVYIARVNPLKENEPVHFFESRVCVFMLEWSTFCNDALLGAHRANSGCERGWFKLYSWVITTKPELCEPYRNQGTSFFRIPYHFWHHSLPMQVNFKVPPMETFKGGVYQKMAEQSKWFGSMHAQRYDALQIMSRSMCTFCNGQTK